MFMGQGQRFQPIGSLTNHFQVGLGVDQAGQSLSEEVVVVGE